MARPTLLLTGASGFLGWALCHRLQQDYRVVGTHYRHRPEDLPAVHWERINLLETAAIGPLVQRIRPQAIVHLAAISNTTFCEEHPALSHHINVYSTVALAEAAAQWGIPLLMASTDLVFNGNSAPYGETDLTHPLSQYGQQKEAAESILLTDFEQTLVGRLPWLFGIGPDYVNNFFTKIVAALRTGETVQAFEDEYRSMISTQTAAEWWAHAIRYALDEGQPWAEKERLLHFGGAAGYSRYEFLVEVARHLGVSTALVERGQQAQAPYAHTRPADVRLDSGLARKLFGYEPPTLAAQLRAL